MKKISLFFITLLCAQTLFAHPHAFIDMKTKVLVDKQQLVGFSMQWILDEPSSAAVLYDVKQAKSDKKALQKLIDEVIGNVVNEHYFSYFIRLSIFLNYRKIVMAKCWSLISMKNLKLTPPR